MQQNRAHKSYFDGNSTLSLITETKTALAMDVALLAQSHFMYKIGQYIKNLFIHLN